ncbi:hypothetical protein ABT174_35210 [Streptomyces sparsogenes]|uniref:hypothetical protein n=1 Tax=Streptomyces sparsogenes TaxID=67365 RepID=UPI003334115C
MSEQESGFEQGDLFDGAAAGARDGRLHFVRPFVAPVASTAGAVTDDPVSLQLAEAIHDAFGDLASDRGLTRSEIAAACASVASGEAFDDRFRVFVGLGMLEQVRGKAYEGRYVFSPTSGAALLVFERLAEAGGVEEIMTLLDRTQVGLTQGLLSEEQLANRLRRVRRDLSITTAHLLRLVRSKPIEELVGERHHHQSKAALLDHARQLVKAISSRFPRLRASGTRLIDEALRYSAAVDEFSDRLLQQVRARRDFSMLLPEQYLSAALGASVDALAEVFAATVFDPASVEITAAQVLVAAGERRPPVPRRRPARPAPLPPGPDPVEAAREKALLLRRRRSASMNSLVRGGQEADLTATLGTLPWRTAIATVVDLLQASADPATPFFVEIGEEVLVNPAGAVTYASPLSLYRLPQDVSGAVGGDSSAVQEGPA